MIASRRNFLYLVVGCWAATRFGLSREVGYPVTIRAEFDRSIESEKFETQIRDQVLDVERILAIQSRFVTEGRLLDKKHLFLNDSELWVYRFIDRDSYLTWLGEMSKAKKLGMSQPVQIKYTSYEGLDLIGRLRT